jgi:hypothetical protein
MIIKQLVVSTFTKSFQKIPGSQVVHYSGSGLSTTGASNGNTDVTAVHRMLRKPSLSKQALTLHSGDENSAPF